MSADRPDPEPFVDDRHDDADEIDPYGIVPEGFVESYGASSIPEALAKAERADTKTDPDEFPRCPHCGSIRLRKKHGALEMAHKRPETYKCSGCGEHFDNPAPSREAARAGTQATLREVSRR